MESFATGLKRIQKSCDDAGCKVEYYGDDYGFTVRFYRHSGGTWSDAVLLEQADGQANGQAEITRSILAFCSLPRTLKEIQLQLGFRNRKTATKYVKELVENRKIIMTFPDSPKHPDQKYVALSRER